MTQFKYFINELSEGNFNVLIDLYVSITSVVKNFIFSDPKITLVFIVFSTFGVIFSFVRRLFLILITGGALVIVLFFPEIAEQASKLGQSLTKLLMK